jgi:polysaccharide export outer membrane protein
MYMHARKSYCVRGLFLAFSLYLVQAVCQTKLVPGLRTDSSAVAERSYLLGPNDQITIRCLDVEEIADKPTRVDTDGNISLPLLGRFRVAGLTIERLEYELKQRLKDYVYSPQLSIAVNEYRSQPVSLLGAVQTPGSYQLQGQKTIIEVISLGGGLRPDAGSTISVTRRYEAGNLPLRTAHPDPTSNYVIATLDTNALMNGDPSLNIAVKPFDVISVSRAQLVYAIGQVKKPGGFILTDGRDVSVLKVLSLAEGTLPSAASHKARILRTAGTNRQRQEIPLNISKILDGKSPDMILRPEDILFIPTHQAKNAAMKAVDVVIQAGTGIAIYRR